jgi:putative tryptophan/tyrosine transport system substrate-binding protein
MFLAGTGAVLLAAPPAAEAQPAGKMYRVGLLDYAPFWEPLLQGLRDLGYVEGQNIAIEYRPAEGRYDRLPRLAAELVRLKVDVIVTYGTPATRAAKQATTTVPIIMVATGDPLRTGLVSSLSRPEANVTGHSFLTAEIVGKRLELLKEAIPRLSRVAFLWNPTNLANARQFEEVQVGARTVGVRLQSVEVRSPDGFESAFAAIVREHPDALLMTADTMLTLHALRIIDFAAKRRLPTMFQTRELVEAGGLMSYGASLPELFRRAATYVDRILKGAKPADLPVEQPTKFELVINLKTAKALGLTIPPALLQRAEEVIQ